MTTIRCCNYEAGNTLVLHQTDLASLEYCNMEGLEWLLAGSMELPSATELAHMASMGAARTGRH